MCGQLLVYDSISPTHFISQKGQCQIMKSITNKINHSALVTYCCITVTTELSLRQWTLTILIVSAGQGPGNSLVSPLWLKISLTEWQSSCGLGLQPQPKAQLEDDPVVSAHMWLLAGLNSSLVIARNFNSSSYGPFHRTHQCSQSMRSGLLKKKWSERAHT